jgi:hypothetical protein
VGTLYEVEVETRWDCCTRNDLFKISKMKSVVKVSRLFYGRRLGLVMCTPCTRNCTAYSQRALSEKHLFASLQKLSHHLISFVETIHYCRVYASPAALSFTQSYCLNSKMSAMASFSLSARANVATRVKAPVQQRRGKSWFMCTSG